MDKTNEIEEETKFNGYVLVNEPQFVTPSRDLIKRGAFYEKRATNPGKNTIDGITITGTGGLGSGKIEVTVSRPNLNQCDQPYKNRTNRFREICFRPAFPDNS